MPASYPVVQKYLDNIKAEMQTLGLWRNEDLEPEKYDFMQAFAADTMAFPEWLQFIFIPRVQSIIDDKAAFPSSSMVGTKAIREFSGYQEAQQLIDLLCEFDQLFY